MYGAVYVQIELGIFSLKNTLHPFFKWLTDEGSQYATCKRDSTVPHTARASMNV
jgi:hypothetical protein